LFKALRKGGPLCNGKNLVIVLLVVGVGVTWPFKLLSRVKVYVFKDMEYIDLLLDVRKDLVKYRLYLLVVVG
jgi:hypothetical protein